MEILRKYNTATSIYFPLIDAGAADFESTPVTFASGDTQISKDGGTFANTTNNPAHEGNGIYSLALTATEMQAALIVVTIIDSATKAWEDQAAIIATYGNASAQHAFDLDDNDRTGSANTTAPDNAGIAANQTDLNTIIAALLTSTDVQNAAAAALAAIHLDHLLATDYDPTSKPGTATALLNELIENDAGVSRFTANALEQAPSGGGGLTLASFFTTDSGETKDTAVSGSVVGEITAAITAGSAGSTEVTDITIDDGTNPIEGAALWISTDSTGTNVVWSGTTDASGNPKDNNGNNPFLDPGTYYIWAQLGGYTFSNPTSHTVS